ncbi:helix-turn-helix domain-containing protein [Fusobacterium ulcerans]|uniref:helix-turn-helix domain-containing protein n=1 Tax=Fusobacterium ulcerans TaxID=861 RepID=UPI001D09A9C3|nr:helix-turn-helix domain-containing protein [Fusobacterium ulcerans]MCB8565290.1 helix-turn-helix domain-containing protein [Fusobacterium ulcerans]MCB8649226.1 helix-turn-helix domain-containing protein [Fusobacterium ulcerans]
MDKVKMQGVFEKGYGFVAKKVMRDKTLNILSKAVYAYICSYAGKGKDAFPSQNLICGDLGIGKSTLLKYIKELKDRGYITVIQHKEKGKFAQNLYTVNVIPCIVSSDTTRTDTNPTARGQVNTNNNQKNNNNIKDKKINNTHTGVEEKTSDSVEHKNELEKEKLSDAPMEIQDILKKYKDLGLPEYSYRPDNYVILGVWRELGAVKLFEALTLMSESKFVKNNMSINSIFKIENLKKALNGNFKDKRKVKKNEDDAKKKFERTVYENSTGSLIKGVLDGTIGRNGNGEM